MRSASICTTWTAWNTTHTHSHTHWHTHSHTHSHTRTHTHTLTHTRTHTHTHTRTHTRTHNTHTHTHSHTHTTHTHTHTHKPVVCWHPMQDKSSETETKSFFLTCTNVRLVRFSSTPNPSPELRNDLLNKHAIPIARRCRVAADELASCRLSHSASAFTPPRSVRPPPPSSVASRHVTSRHVTWVTHVRHELP